MKFWITILIALFAATGAFAQVPVNDNCATATLLPVVPASGTCAPAAIPYTNINATTVTTDPAAPLCWAPATISHNVWFRFVPTTSAVSITTSAASGANPLTNSQIAVYSGTCGTLTEIACNENASLTNLHTSLTVTALVPGNTYFIMVDGNTNLTGNFDICVKAISQPNDNCANAIALPVGNNVCVADSFSNVGATSVATDPMPTCWTPAVVNHNVWFTFVPGSSQVQINTNFFGNSYTLTNTQVAVFSGSCGTLTQIACNEDIAVGSTQSQFLVNGLTPGATYYIMVDGNNNMQGSFGICVQNILLTNDNCAGAITLPVTSGSCNSPVFTNVGATTVATDPAATCFVPTALSNSVWFSFTATSTSIEISTNFNGPAFTLSNTQVALYSGTCGSLTYLACEEDVNTINGLLKNNFQVHGLTVGNTYYLLVDGNDNLTGTFGICVQSIPTPPPATPNNTCETANPYNPLCPINFGTVVSQPNNTTWSPTCFGTNIVAPWMYTFTATTSGTFGFVVTPTTPVDYDVAFYNITPVPGQAINNCPTPATVASQQLGCNFSGSTAGNGVTGVGINCNNPGLCDTNPLASSVIAGNTYLIVISRWNTASTAGFALDLFGTGAPTSGLTLNPSFNASAACVNSPVQFTNTTPGAGALTHSWNFGDNTTSTAINPTHTYTAAGTYAVTLTSTSTCGTGPSAVTTSNSVTNFVTISNSPQANFSVETPVCVNQPSTVYYTGPSLGGGNYVWGLDGGTIVGGGADSLEVAWATPGTKTVTLQIILGSCSTTVNTLLVEVLPLPTVTLTPPNPAICSGQSINLTATGAVSYSWYPGTFVTPTTGDIVSVSPGTPDTVTVVGTAPNGCTNTATTPIGVDVFELVFFETMGSPPVAATTTTAAHEGSNSFDNDQLLMTALAADIRSVPTQQSTGYTGASGGNYVFINFNNIGNPVNQFQIEDINTIGLNNLELSFGLRKAAVASNGTQLALEYSTDGVSYTALSFPALSTLPGSAGWYYIGPVTGLPATPNLRIRWRNTVGNMQFLIDDITLRNPWSAPTITPGGTVIAPGSSITLTASAAALYSWSGPGVTPANGSG
ncbi:MAG: PKD domain-containing protein, partial [Sphingobacteriales bacterium]